MAIHSAKTWSSIRSDSADPCRRQPVRPCWSALLQNMLMSAYGAAAYDDVPEGHFMTINDIDGSGAYNLTAADKLGM